MNTRSSTRERLLTETGFKPTFMSPGTISAILNSNPYDALTSVIEHAGFDGWDSSITVVIVFTGFFMIAYGLISFRIGQDLSSAQPWPAIITGVITEFIATTILFVYSSVFRQTKNYFRTLERLTAIGMAIRILDDITDDPACRIKEHNKAKLYKAFASAATH